MIKLTANQNHNKEETRNNPISTSLSLSHHSHVIVKSACSSTFYPELCFSAIASEPNVTHKVTNHRDVIQLSLSITFRAVERNYFTVKKLLTKHDLTKRETTALHDCLETIDEPRIWSVSQTTRIYLWISILDTPTSTAQKVQICELTISVLTRVFLLVPLSFYFLKYIFPRLLNIIIKNIFLKNQKVILIDHANYFILWSSVKCKIIYMVESWWV